MDCNKDEALRAKEVAEKKMLNNDFEGAKKVALKAEQLYPQLENISQLLAVCNVHCSAQMGSERDWYRILQIDRQADEITIKKQYRRLALVLHPDKNKLPGAEAAFKLIVEANMVLSDPVKRSAYDNKNRGLPKPPPHQRNQFFRQANYQNVFNASSGNLNHHQHTRPNSSSSLGTFWTVCPYCNVKYQYLSNYINNALRCQKCLKPFIAYDLGTQGAPGASSGGPKWSQHGVQNVHLKSNLNQPYEKRELPNQGTSKMTSGSATGSRQGLSSGTAGPEPEICRGKTTSLFEDIKTKGKAEKLAGGRKGAAKPKVDRKSKKRGRKQTVESSESSDTSTSVEEEELDIEIGNGPSAGQGFVLDGYSTRRSSRRRHSVSYNDDASDDEVDFANPLKKARSDQSAVDGDQNHAGVARSCSNSAEGLHQNGVGIPEGDEKSNNSKIGTVNEQASRPPSGGAEKVEFIVDDSDSESDTGSGGEPPNVYDYPDPEFSDFDKHKAENCFEANQIWACYDNVDGMPRFYAHIRKVSTPKFNILFSWLEADPEDIGDAAWVEVGLPVGCGKFKRGSTETTSDRLTFSHQVQCEMGMRGLYSIYPVKGETWALFKDWDIHWSSNPGSHKQYKFEIVEILSDYTGDDGVQVVYLDKVSGFVSLFQRTRLTEVNTYFVKPTELYKFSHRIPSFKMTGTEREGVPAGSFELDPASIPVHPDDIWYPGKVKDSRTAKSEPVGKVSSAVSPGTRDKSKNAMASQNSVNLKGIHATDGESTKIRRSPSGVNIPEKKQGKVSSSSASGSTSTEFDSNCVEKNGHSSSSVPSHLSCPAGKGLPSGTKSFSVGNSSGSSKNPITLADDKGFDEVFCDFKMDISLEKFQVDQVWALYQNNLPKTYGQIKKIVPSLSKLHVALLEACSAPKSASQLVCGTFKVQNEKRQIFASSSFSHMVKAVAINKNKFEIYPREGEIWALYKNMKTQIVEVIEFSKAQIKVSSMVRVDGFKSVFKSPRNEKTNPVILVIPKKEFVRFSHQIPAFQLTGEKGGTLRGCWELDPASVPYPL